MMSLFSLEPHGCRNLNIAYLLSDRMRGLVASPLIHFPVGKRDGLVGSLDGSTWHVISTSMRALWGKDQRAMIVYVGTLSSL